MLLFNLSPYILSCVETCRIARSFVATDVCKCLIKGAFFLFFLNVIKKSLRLIDFCMVSVIDSFLIRPGLAPYLKGHGFSAGVPSIYLLKND